MALFVIIVAAIITALLLWNYPREVYRVVFLHLESRKSRQ